MGMNAPDPKDGMCVAPAGILRLAADAAAGAKGKTDDRDLHPVRAAGAGSKNNPAFTVRDHTDGHAQPARIVG
ncbi:MAG: hypothetical protein HoeaKO_41910 [Hoeflea alexandrii]